MSPSEESKYILLKETLIYLTKTDKYKFINLYSKYALGILNCYFLIKY